MDEHIPTLLSSHAAQLSGDIFTVLTKGRLKPSDLGYKEAHDIAVRLHLINTYLDSLPPYWIELDVEQLCHIVLRDLQAITQPARESTSSSFHLSLSFFKSSFNQKSHLNPETCLITFFKTRIENARNFKASCDNLLGRLAKEDRDADELPESALQQVDIPSKSDHNDGIFKALQHITQCEPASHQINSTTASIGIDPQTIRHPARLCLHELPDSLDSASRCILVLVSAINMTLWQEFCLNIQPEIPADANQKLLSRGGFCRILEREITARLFLSFNFDKSLSLLNKTQVLKQILQAGPGESLKSVLRHYDLTPKDKVMLSYAIARSYWQYYDSELMRTKWTSDTIWFMSERDGREHNGQLPLCAYLSFPFGISGDITPDVIHEDLLNHRCPRIFDIGVLLLEIGLAKPFRSGNRRDIVAQANLNHKIATDELVELEKREWDGFTNKMYFDRAVKFCLNSENFIPPSKQLKPIRGGFRPSTGPMAPSDSRAGILMRRKIFHKNVVRPLAWLAKRGFKAQAGDIAYVDKKPDLSLQKELSNAQIQQESEVLFHSSIVSKAWLNDLKKISELVERKRRQFAVTNPVRIAILDTGLNKDFLTFKTKSGLLKSIVDEEDFVDPCAQTITDTFGHGTFMARLIMECAPGADILVARVAENTKELENSRENIKKAILWAGRAGKADIISMSFGFPYDDQTIREAIETVQKERQEEIIFLASAGNSSTDDESFPARHSAVISVYATNCYGAFLQSNSASISNGAAVLGTYGDDLPDFIREEFSTTYPEACQPGSSVATAIMAGISATMLAYTTALPLIVPFQGILASTCSNVLQRLRTTKGMEEVLCRLVRQDLDHRRLKAVNPRWFWKSRPTDVDRYIAICDTLRNLDGRFSRGTRTG